MKVNRKWAFAGIGVCTIGIIAGVIGSNGGHTGLSPQCAAVESWMTHTLDPTSKMLTADTSQLQADATNAGPVITSAEQADGTQLSQDALHSPANFPWATVGHSGPLAQVGSDWAILLLNTEIMGNAYSTGNLPLAVSMGNQTAQQGDKLIKDINAADASCK